MSFLPGFFPGSVDSDSSPTVYTTTMAAGFALSAFGYTRSPWVPPAYEIGSISNQPIPGQTLVALYYSPGAGGSTIGFSGHIAATLSGLKIWVNGVQYPFTTDWQEISPAEGNFTQGLWTGGAAPQFEEFSFYDIEIK